MPTTWLPPSDWTVSRPAWVAGSASRRVYRRLLPVTARRPVPVPGVLAADVVGFSCERDLPEQVASLRSLLRWVGRPATFTVVSDGTHTAASRRLLRRVDPCVRVVDWDAALRPGLPRAVLDYAAAHPMGRKLAVELCLPPDRTTVYLDSDVLLFPPASELHEVVAADEPAYLLDPEEVYLDDRLLRPGESSQPLNAGLLVLPPHRLDWRPALDRLQRLDGPPGFHTEQTLVHLTMRAAGARPLDPTRYVVATDDMPRLRDPYRSPSIALRHYTTPVRHRFWSSVPRSALAGRRVGRAAPDHGGAPVPTGAGAGAAVGTAAGRTLR